MFTREYANSLKNSLLDLDTLKFKTDSMQKSLTYYEQLNTNNETRVNNLLEQNTKLAAQLNSERSMSTLERVGWFALGVLATGVAIYGAKQAIR